ncbi:tRNA1(Val) (adenine(37)-N6)-methyltransferase [Dongia deserti]|uniref:tRNA1(Val) (adenine(37)-N6)-methyltransferase n=1 Tax=Dongia deserti TaxID=2268030 RepID=UPI000E65B6FB|nr:methyltransferase domain-containing protein [Dongia deserti]
MNDAPTTLDTVLGGRVTLHQPAVGYRVAIDPILLAAACPAEAGETIVDLGCGVGTAALCLARRVADVRCTGVDLQPELAALADRNAQENKVADRVRFVAGDILDRSLPIYAEPADHVIVNPPYLKRGTATPSANPAKALANVEGDADLAAWVAAAAKAVRPGGTITFIHRADRLPELLALLGARCGGLVVLPLHPKAGAAAHRTIVACRLDQRLPAMLLPGLVLHEADGSFSPVLQRVLRDGAPLPMSVSA